MNGSEKDEITISELMQFAAGKAEGEVFERVSKALGDPNHPASYLLHRQRGTPSQRSRIQPPDIPDPEDSAPSQSLDDAIAESANAGIQPYLQWEREQLEAALLADLPDSARTDAEVVYRSGTAEPWNVLEPYAAQLREIVRNAWNWPKLKKDSQLTTDEAIASNLAQYLKDHQTNLPFRPVVLAVALLRFGLDRVAGIK